MTAARVVARHSPWPRIYRHACNVTVSLALWTLIIKLVLLIAAHH